MGYRSEQWLAIAAQDGVGQRAGRYATQADPRRSHISAMERLLHSDAPLFGRLEGKLQVQPFPFPKIAPFVPSYSLQKRLAVYANLGGVPDYLRRWNDRADLMTNIRDIFLSDLSPFRNEQHVLISDMLRRDSPDYESVLSSVGRGNHELKAITLESGIKAPTRVADVLTTLEDVRLIERRVRARIKPDDQKDARYTRYHLIDPFLQFYYRFVEPNRISIALKLYDNLGPVFQGQMRCYVGYAFEALCRQWALIKARNSELPSSPEFIGSNWGSTTRTSEIEEHNDTSGAIYGYQADVVAINWSDRQVFIGEAKWADEDMDHKYWRDFEDSVRGVMARLRSVDARTESRAKN